VAERRLLRARLSSNEEERKQKNRLKVVNDEGLLPVSKPPRRDDLSLNQPTRRSATVTAENRGLTLFGIPFVVTGRRKSRRLARAPQLSRDMRSEKFRNVPRA
jgi:hypothetical protein